MAKRDRLDVDNFFSEVDQNQEVYNLRERIKTLEEQLHQQSSQEHSSAIFKLPQGGDRSPDVAWVSRDRWAALTPAEQDGFPPICPDFVIELRSRTDLLKPLQEKMQEYLSSGLRLGWLINPQDEQVEVYRTGRSIEILQFPVSLSGEDVLPNFTLNLPL